MIQQIYHSSYANPNDGNIMPENNQLSALYHNDPKTAWWIWSVAAQGWEQVPFQLSPPLPQVYGGYANPESSPEDSTRINLFVNMETREIFFWDYLAPTPAWK